MDWETGIYELFEKIMAKTPEMFRESIRPMLLEAAERRARLRNSGTISKTDLLTGLFEITPEAFKPTVVDDLKSLGIDTDKYIKITSIRDKYRRTWDEIGAVFLPGVMHLTLFLTDRCNQRCLHCAADMRPHRPEISTEQWIYMIDNVENSLRKVGRHANFIWFGGEPTLREDFADILRHCGEKGYFHSVSSNGLLFNEDLMELCQETKMSHLYVSFDSVDPKKAAYIRGHPNAYYAAEKAIKLAIEYGMFTLCTITVQKANLDELEDIKELLESWGAIPYFRAVIKQRNAATHWDEIGLNQEEYKKLYDFRYGLVIDAIRQGKATSINKFFTHEMIPFMECPLNDEERTALEWGVGCQACRIAGGIDVNGDFFPCNYPSNLVLGNLLEQSFTEIMNTQLFKDIRDRKRVGFCTECHHIDLCGGGCRVHAECETGNFFESFPYCWHKMDHEHIGNKIVKKIEAK